MKLSQDNKETLITAITVFIVILPIVICLVAAMYFTYKQKELDYNKTQTIQTK